MAESPSPFAYLRDARLASHAAGSVPVWLWQADGHRILWANAAAAVFCGAASPAALRAQSADTDDPNAAEIAHLAESLPANGSPRIATFQSLTAPDGEPLMALCSRLTIGRSTAGVLVIAIDTEGGELSLEQRVQLLLGEGDMAVAAFTPDGSLLHATTVAVDSLGAATTLAAFDAAELGRRALAAGHAEGTTALGKVRIDRIGREADTVLLASLPPPPATAKEEAAPPLLSTEAAGDPGEAVESTESVEPASSPAPPLASDRPQLLRFVWQTDQDGRFTLNSDTFLALVGAPTAALNGQPWLDVAAKLGLDPDQQISGAIESRDTWSGITVQWPVEGAGDRLTVEMSGLPTFDRERNFRGYRGFGVCRNAERLTRCATAATPASPPVIEPPRPALSPVEQTAFDELARQLTARLKHDGAQPFEVGPAAAAQDVAGGEGESVPPPQADAGPKAEPAAAIERVETATEDARAILDCLPIGILVYRLNTPLYANRAFLRWSGDSDLEAFAAAGGLDRLYLESGIVGNGDDSRAMMLTAGSPRGKADSRLFSVLWDGERAHVLAIVPAADHAAAAPAPSDEESAFREASSILYTAADAVVVIDADGQIVRLDPGAEALFGADNAGWIGRRFLDLLNEESRAVAGADLAALIGDADARHSPREVTGRRLDGSDLPLTMRLGRIDADDTRYCAVFHDISRWKETERALVEGRRRAEQASQAKSDFLAKISHEIRTPLNAIIGFSEVMMEERLGPIDNERYLAYLKDIHASGEHLLALLNDLLDLSKIEAGKLDLTFSAVDLNALTQECVALMQPQANRGRVIVRTSLAPGLPPIQADPRSVRQILLNLLSNSVKFTGAGGQVIVSTAVMERGDAVLRVRDTGIGMSEQEIATALEPYRQIETATHGGPRGTGLGLPLTKALAEANRANFAIRSNLNSGTLVEVAFPTGTGRDR